MTVIRPPVFVPPKKKRSFQVPPVIKQIAWLVSLGSPVVIGVFLVAGMYLYQLSQDLPDYARLKVYAPPVMTRIYANDGSLLAEYARERRIYVPIDAIPKRVIQAFLSAEDKNFWEHSGLDYIGVLRAIVTNLKNYGRNRRAIGASTITQQVAKNFLLSDERSLTRKAKEAMLSLRIEKALNKQQILQLYLNQIYLGFRSFGVAAAALNYFNKRLDELTIDEAAYLAALPKGPNNYHPFRRTKRAITRRNWVIDRMVENGYVTPEEAEIAKARPLNVHPRHFGVHIADSDYFTEEVRRDLIKQYIPAAERLRQGNPARWKREIRKIIRHYRIFPGKKLSEIPVDKLLTAWAEDKVATAGLSVRTTLDPRLQGMAKKALVAGLVRYDRRQGWRGPVTTIDTAGKWGTQLFRIKVPQDIAPWRLAVVLEIDSKKAIIGLRPGRQKNGRIAAKRETGVLPLREVKWARRHIKKFKRWTKLGPKIRKVTQVLSVGDVVYVAPKPADKKAQTDKPAIYRLMQIPKIGGAMVVMDPHTGRVLALVGGFSYDMSEFNRATQALRQPGSAFKPVVYAAALDQGYTPATVVIDAPIVIDQGPDQEPWKPHNYGGKFYGPSTLRIGIEHSRNLMTVRLAQNLGMPTIAEYARRFGVYDKLPPLLSMSLGAGETTLLRMTTAYCIMDNGGRKVNATLIDSIQDRTGKSVFVHDKRPCTGCNSPTGAWLNQPEPELPDIRPEVINPQTAYQITSMLEGVVERGTGKTVKKVKKPLAGKTGTTNDERDAWFVGFSPDLVAGVFIGYDNPIPMGHGATGGGLAAPVFRDFMMMALADKPAVPFRMPEGIRIVKINPKTGLRARPGDKQAIDEAFKSNDQLPPEYDPLLDQHDQTTGQRQENVSGWQPTDAPAAAQSPRSSPDFDDVF